VTSCTVLHVDGDPTCVDNDDAADGQHTGAKVDATLRLE